MPTPSSPAKCCCTRRRSSPRPAGRSPTGRSRCAGAWTSAARTTWTSGSCWRPPSMGWARTTRSSSTSASAGRTPATRRCGTTSRRPTATRSRCAGRTAEIGWAQSPAKNDPDVTEGSGGQDGGVGNNHAVYVGGSWFALNGPLVWALGDLDQRDYAWDEFLRNTLAQHATVYPNHWDGVLSVDDACREWYSTDPADCGVGLTTNYDTQIMHQPAWALVDAVKLAGLEPVAGGYRVIPRVPMKTFSLRLPDVGVAAAPGVLRGYVVPGRTGALKMSVAGPAGAVAYADGRRVAARAHDGMVDFELPAQAGQAERLGGPAAVAAAVGEVGDERARVARARGRRTAVAPRPARGEARDVALEVRRVAVVRDDGVRGAVDVEEPRAGAGRARVE